MMMMVVVAAGGTVRGVEMQSTTVEMSGGHGWRGSQGASLDPNPT